MQDKLKIVIVGPGYPYRNGQSIFLASLYNKLKDKFDLSWINFSMLYPRILFPGKSQYDYDKSEEMRIGNKRLIHTLNPLSWKKTAQYINELNPDLVAFDWWHPFTGPAYWGIIKMLNKPLRQKLLFITENVISHESNKLDTIFTKLALNNARCFLALSDSVEKHLNSLFNKKIFKSALPIYDFYEKNGNASVDILSDIGWTADQEIFLYFGLVRKYKGVDILINAFKEYAERNERARLLVVGEFYDDPQPYFDLVKANNLEEKVKIVNQYIPDDKVKDYFSLAECVVLPYRSATQSGIMSMAFGFGKPVIVTDVGELANLVIHGETGLVAQPDEESLIEQLSLFEKLKKGGVDFEANVKKHRIAVDKFNQIDQVFDEILAFVKTP